MIYNIYAMRDELTGFLPPTYDINDAAAMRILVVLLRLRLLIRSGLPFRFKSSMSETHVAVLVILKSLNLISV